jgi:hypothetical protein
MDPPLLDAISFATYFEQQNDLMRLTSSVLRNSAKVFLKAGALTDTPALFTNISIPLNSSSVLLMSRITSFSSVTSVGIAIALEFVVSVIAEAASSPVASIRFAMTTEAPASASACAIALPIPRSPPVTIGTSSLSRNLSSTGIRNSIIGNHIDLLN